MHFFSHTGTSTAIVGFAFLLSAASVFAQTTGTGQTLDTIQWRDSPVPGVQNSVHIGNPAATGLYVVLGKMSLGSRFPAHKHPDARVTTVLKGTMYYASGSDLSDAAMVAYPTGAIVQTPAGVAHVMWARDGDVVMQETGIGPSGLVAVDTAHK